MSLFSLTIAYLRARRLTSSLLVVLLALGIATVSLLFHFSYQAEQRLTRDSRGIDLVVGAKGSPLQLILSSIYAIDIPTGNIPRSEADRLMKHPHVRKAIPLALGDSYHGFRIVGTEPDYIHHYKADLASGHLWAHPMEAVVGATAAKRASLGVGSTFAGSHGLVESSDVHSEFPYKVVGVLQPTGSVLDRLILTPVESVWRIHEGHHHDEEGEHEAHDEHEHHADHHDQGGHEEEPHASQEITALLITYRNPIAAMSLPREINRTTGMQAASPAMETARLLNLLGIGIDTLRLFGGILISSAVIGILVAIYQSMQERRYDLAIMRVLGGSKGTLLKQVLLEAGMLLVTGISLGLLLSHAVLVLLPKLWPQMASIGFVPFFLLPEEIIVAAGLLVTGSLVALLPALTIYRMDVSRTLAQG